MKYELTQGQYTDFLNMLPWDQAQNHFVPLTAPRMTITGVFAGAKPVFNCTTPERACYFMDATFAFAHAMAYADWAALRPITEMEYEKAARGPGLPVDKENPGARPTSTASRRWSTTARRWKPLRRPGQRQQQPLQPERPRPRRRFRHQRLRPRQGRRQLLRRAGTGGNVSERVVATGAWRNRAGAALTPGFDGQMGDGALNTQGLHDPPGWPRGRKIAPTTGSEYGHKGGNFSSPNTVARTADRSYAANNNDYTYNAGASAARAAPGLTTADHAVHRGSADMRRTLAAAMLAAAFLMETALANSIAISSTTLKGRPQRKAEVTFNIAWDNSWRDSANYDAAWIFAKYSADAGARGAT